jgi:hypothetical protein
MEFSLRMLSTSESVKLVARYDMRSTGDVGRVRLRRGC